MLQNRLRVEFIFIEIILATFILLLHFYCFVVLRNIFLATILSNKINGFETKNMLAT